MTPDEQTVSERAEAALKANAEAYRLAQEALDMRRENERLRNVLLWYADRAQYEPPVAILQRSSAVLEDRGERARAALGAM